VTDNFVTMSREANKCLHTEKSSWKYSLEKNVKMF